MIRGLLDRFASAGCNCVEGITDELHEKAVVVVVETPQSVPSVSALTIQQKVTTRQPAR